MKLKKGKSQEVRKAMIGKCFITVVTEKKVIELKPVVKKLVNYNYIILL